MGNLDVLNLNGTRYELTDTGARSSFAPIESATSTRAYAKDQFLVYNGTLYKTLTAITVGTTLTVGTNIEQTRVGDEITDLYSLIDTHTREITQHDYDLLPSAQKNDGTMYMITDGIHGDFDIMEMTQNDYNLLPDSQKNNNALYMLTDGTPQSLAEDVVYDNSSSHLSANRVQSAIDELARGVTFNTHAVDVCLGTSFTSEQKAAINDGSFKGLCLDGYWLDGTRKWRIWGANWYKNKGDTQCTTDHLVIMPDDNLLKADGYSTNYMNDSNTTTGGYAGTKLRSTYVSQMKNTIASFFGADHILSHRELLCNAVSDGKASGWAWYDSTVEIPSECMMYGTEDWANFTDGGAGYNMGTAYPILPLAMIKPERVVNRETFWLRDVVSASGFAIVGDSGIAGGISVSFTWRGVRPFFLLF